MPEGGTIQKMPGTSTAKTEVPKRTVAEKVKIGKDIFGTTCFACHQSEGQGIPGTFPPLAKSDHLNADSKRAIKTILHGLTGEVTVNGKKYNNVMPAQNLSDDEIANVLTYIYSNWGNNKTEITPEMVKALR